MFQSRARNLVLALSLFAAVANSLLPGADAAAAASIPAAESVTNGQWEFEQVKPKPKPQYIVQQTPVPFNSDLRVTHALTTPFPNGSATYTFKIENIGLNTSGEITVKEEWTQTPCGNVYCLWHPGTYRIPALASGAHTYATIFCNTQDQPMVCSGARLGVTTPNDPTQSNNVVAVGLI